MQPKDPLRMERASAEPVSLEPPVQGSPSPAQPNTRHEAKPCCEQPLQPPLTQRHLYSKHETPGVPPTHGHPKSHSQDPPCRASPACRHHHLPTKSPLQMPWSIVKQQIKMQWLFSTCLPIFAPSSMHRRIQSDSPDPSTAFWGFSALSKVGPMCPRVSDGVMLPLGREWRPCMSLHPAPGGVFRGEVGTASPCRAETALLTAAKPPTKSTEGIEASWISLNTGRNLFRVKKIPQLFSLKKEKKSIKKKKKTREVRCQSLAGAAPEEQGMGLQPACGRAGGGTHGAETPAPGSF